MTHNKKSILLIGNFLSTTGVKHGTSKDLYEQLVKNRWQVFWASRYSNRVLRLLDMVSSAIKWRNQYRTANIDVFSGRSFIWAEIMVWVFKLLKKPFVCTLRGGSLPEYESSNPKRILRLINRASKVTTPSNYLFLHFSSIRDDITLIPNGIDLSSYQYISRKVIDPKIIWLRAFHEIYSPTLAVEVLHLLQNKFPSISLTMVGPDKGDGSLEKVQALAAQYGLEDALYIIGGVAKKEVPVWLNKGDIFINTTRVESFGVSVMEAAACGLPIVTTDAGELSYMWEDGVDALVVPVDDADAMAEAVQRILREPGLAEELSVNARKKSEDYDWSMIIIKWSLLFESLINDNKIVKDPPQ